MPAANQASGVELTDHEAGALGFLATNGPSTPYAVRRCFLASPSARFSGSAGTIYPLLRRLEERGLVASVAAPTGNRPARVCRITRSGLGLLRRWLNTAFHPAETFADDPFRTRIGCLSVLTARDRAAWLDKAEACLREQLVLIECAAEEDAHSIWKTLAHQNAARLTHARLEWIAETRRTLRKQSLT